MAEPYKKKMQYLNIIAITALILYLAYRMYQNLQMGVIDNLLLHSLTLAVAVDILVYLIIMIRKKNS